MSYILEALKKSDQQRQQGAAPTLSSVQLPVEESRERKFPWLVALAAIVFIAGILIGWLQPWTSGQSAATAQPAEKAIVRQPEVIPLAKAPAPVIVPVETAAAPTRNQEQVQVQKAVPVAPVPAAPLPVPVQAPQVAAKPATAAVARLDPPPAAARTPAATVREPTPAAAPAKSSAAPEQNVMAKMELPPAILQELPAMTVSLHAYSSKPSNRLVSINDKLLQEGDSLAPGLLLEEITRKDMIFTYKGYRFRQGMQ